MQRLYYTHSYQMFHLAFKNCSQYGFEPWYIPKMIKITMFHHCESWSSEVKFNSLCHEMSSLSYKPIWNIKWQLNISGVIIISNVGVNKLQHIYWHKEVPIHDMLFVAIVTTEVKNSGFHFFSFKYMTNIASEEPIF